MLRPLDIIYDNYKFLADREKQFTTEQYEKCLQIHQRWKLPESHPNYVPDDDITFLKEKILGGNSSTRLRISGHDGTPVFSIAVPSSVRADSEVEFLGKIRRFCGIDISIDGITMIRLDVSQYRGSGTIYHYESDVMKIDLWVNNGSVKSLIITLKKPPESSESSEFGADIR